MKLPHVTGHRPEGLTPSFFSWEQALLVWELKADEPGTAGIVVPLAGPRRVSHTLAGLGRALPSSRGFLSRSFGSLWPSRCLWLPLQGMRAASGPPWQRGRLPLTLVAHGPAGQRQLLRSPRKQGQKEAANGAAGIKAIGSRPGWASRLSCPATPPVQKALLGPPAAAPGRMAGAPAGRFKGRGAFGDRPFGF